MLSLKIVFTWLVLARCLRKFSKKNNVIRLLVSHLAFETVQEHRKYTIVSKATSIHAVVLASNKPANGNLNLKVLEDDEMKKITNPLGNGKKKASNFQNVIETTMAMRAQTKNPTNGVNVNHQHQHSLCAGGLGFSNKGREFEDPATKAYMSSSHLGGLHVKFSHESF
nr:uncharacterized protein LOC109167727 [Ipomoea batatas]